ncbi:hypothetical protein A3J15_00065 [Candidatus Roizmanbacteria bacterium RIFCSPLOWO2_02_FULL_38_10]|uniref:Uncharacterized protein n=1 Tax=Candidatus Roizmanbacteria bacterium RIFCSPLOWO2_02_FULL_38_10 TaxID=1802074 RepID=A0A1F7JL06_9BACT|nr:MAG: hypothetical protein A3J15_00065 [Candidatus Roizmanbacteria bacterium RIFCSPLOWO2_02_FULL_38_10]
MERLDHLRHEMPVGSQGLIDWNTVVDYDPSTPETASQVLTSPTTLLINGWTILFETGTPRGEIAQGLQITFTRAISPQDVDSGLIAECFPMARTNAEMVSTMGTLTIEPHQQIVRNPISDAIAVGDLIVVSDLPDFADTVAANLASYGATANEMPKLVTVFEFPSTFDQNQYRTLLSAQNKHEPVLKTLARLVFQRRGDFFNGLHGDEAQKTILAEALKPDKNWKAAVQSYAEDPAIAIIHDHLLDLAHLHSISHITEAGAHEVTRLADRMNARLLTLSRAKQETLCHALNEGVEILQMLAALDLGLPTFSPAKTEL